MAVRDQGKIIVRDDIKSNAALVRHVTRPFIVPCDSCITGGGLNGFSAEYDDLELAGNGDDDVDNSWLDFVLYSGDASGYWELATAYSYAGQYVYGPTYTTSKLISCAQSEFANVKAAMLDVAQYLLGVGSAVYPNVAAAVNGAAKLFVAYPEDVGYLEAFISVLVAACSLEVLADILAAAGAAAVGVTAALLLEYLWCVL